LRERERRRKTENGGFWRMITIDLHDAHLTENIKAIEILSEIGMFTDADIQKLYDEQIRKDGEK
jgi:hypothetical protein